MSSSNTAVPLTPVFKTGLVNVLDVKTWEPVRVATGASISKVTAPVVPPPDNPVPAVTAVISPVGTVATWAST